jgi:cytochrome c-type biogenesis protein CcmF
MIPELGVLALVLALLVAVVQACLPLAGAWRGIEGWMGVARPAALAQCLFVGLAFACLAWSFLDHDYSVLYVASNSHAELPASLPLRGHLGRPRGLDAAVAADPVGLVAGRGAVQPRPARGAGRARARRDGLAERRPAAVPAVPVQPLRAA